MDRINNPERFSDALIGLACDGLTQLKEVAAVSALERLLSNRLADYSIRHAAARALSTLDVQQAVSIAEGYAQEAVPDRLLACALLGHCKLDSGLAVLSQLCDDKSNAVASCGWETAVALEPWRLVEKLDRGVEHQDSNIRLAAIQVMRELPDVQRCDALHRLAADVHIGVRNSARRVLRTLADNTPELRDRILHNVGDSLMDGESSWQQLEQSLVLLGELRHREWQNEWVRLLEHDRPEVFVTSAWLLHLMPSQEMADDVAVLTLRRSEVPRVDGGSVQLVFLFQHAGFTKAKLLQPLCEKQFGNKVSERPEVRAAGLWALGKINAGNADTAMVAKLLERIFDDDPFFPSTQLFVA